MVTANALWRAGAVAETWRPDMPGGAKIPPLKGCPAVSRVVLDKEGTNPCTVR
jgi:hypothetical protein